MLEAQQIKDNWTKYRKLVNTLFPTRKSQLNKLYHNFHKKYFFTNQRQKNNNKNSEKTNSKPIFKINKRKNNSYFFKYRKYNSRSFK